VKDKTMSKQPENLAVDESHTQPHDPIEDGLDGYPLRDPSEDPRWAVRTVWIWVGMALFLLLFIITLLILGVWFD
jgi:hypothetical protein